LAALGGQPDRGQDAANQPPGSREDSEGDSRPSAADLQAIAATLAELDSDQLTAILKLAAEAKSIGQVVA
jgi:hypothetical protein